MRPILRPDLSSHDVLVMIITCIVLCVTRVDDNSKDFSLFKAKQRESPKKDVFLIQGFCLEKPNSFEVPSEFLVSSAMSHGGGKKLHVY